MSYYNLKIGERHKAIGVINITARLPTRTIFYTKVEKIKLNLDTVNGREYFSHLPHRVNLKMYVHLLKAGLDSKTMKFSKPREKMFPYVSKMIPYGVNRVINI